MDLKDGTLTFLVLAFDIKRLAISEKEVLFHISTFIVTLPQGEISIHLLLCNYSGTHNAQTAGRRSSTRK